MECNICQILKNPSLVLFKTPYWLVSLAPDQGYLGRAYATLLDHKAALHELSAEEWTDFANLTRKIETSWKQAFGADPFNWACMMNNAYQDDPAHPHVHWHIRPRYTQSVELNGQTFTDKSYGHHYDRDQRNFVDDKTLRLIVAKLRSALESSPADVPSNK